MNDLLILLHKYRDNTWDWKNVSENPNITWDIIKGHPERPWEPEMVSRNKNITWEIVKANPEYPWNFQSLTVNPNITWSIIKNNPIYPWKLEYFSYNRNITWDIVRSNPEIKWSFPYLSMIMDFNIIKANPGYPWSRDMMVSNRTITKKTIEENPDFPWSHNFITVKQIVDTYEKSDVSEIPRLEQFTDPTILRNPNITWEMVVNSPHPDWYFKILSCNWFNLRTYFPTDPLLPTFKYWFPGDYEIYLLATKRFGKDISLIILDQLVKIKGS